TRRGVGLPGCAEAVTVPTSLKPKPIAPHESTAAAFLSNPAANPSGPGKVRPSTSRASTGSRTPRIRRTSDPSGGTRVRSLSSPNTRWWIRSAGKRNNSFLTSAYTVLLQWGVGGRSRSADRGGHGRFDQVQPRAVRGAHHHGAGGRDRQGVGLTHRR